MKKIIYILISLFFFIFGFVTAYLLFVFPFKSKTQPIVKSIIPKKWNFSNRQYEFNINNINYFLYEDRYSDLDRKNKTYVIKANIALKNISIEPFIIRGEINRCLVLKNDQSTNFFAVSRLLIEKGIKPGESFTSPIEIEFMGNDYDSSGNKLYPSTDLKIKSCELILTTSNSQITHKNALTKDPVDADIEPLVIMFP